ncbi:MAG: hypothetical protein JKP90_20680, partial [Desulfofustis sp. PB-SRB1]|nr:hypothetical protein [Desulfofustis sp. PB-SRB1]
MRPKSSLTRKGSVLSRRPPGEFDWKLEAAEIARIWRGGCIIRSVFLDRISKAYQETPDLTTML